MGRPGAVDPQSIRTQLAAAEASLVAGRYDEAIAAYQSIRTRTPALSVVGLQLGNAYLQKKDYDRAETEFTGVLKSGAANAAACYHLGEAKAARGLSDEAAAWYQKSAEADPPLDEACDEAGRARSGPGQPRGGDRLSQEGRLCRSGFRGGREGCSRC